MPELAKPVTKPSDAEALPKALEVAADAEEVSYPDYKVVLERHRENRSQCPSMRSQFSLK